MNEGFYISNFSVHFTLFSGLAVYGLSMGI